MNTATVQVGLPPEAPDACLARLRIRVAELAEDLQLPQVPRLDASLSSAVSLRLDGLPLRLPLSLARQAAATPEARATETAERMAAALHAARWQLLRPHLARGTAALEAASSLGLGLSDLAALARWADDAVGCEWAATAQCPPCFELHFAQGRDDAAAQSEGLADEAARSVLGLPIPALTLVPDEALEPAQLRLRLRRVRLPVASLYEPARLGQAALAALRRHGDALIDAPAVAWLLLDGQSASIHATQALLAQGIDFTSLAQALRVLLRDGIKVPPPATLWRALLGSVDALGEASLRSIALPGTRLLRPAGGSAAHGLTERLRAALVGPSLRRHGGEDQARRSVWVMTPRACEAAETRPAEVADTLAALALPCARAEAVLLTPAGHARRVRELLANDLPDLLVVDSAEWPPGIEAVFRDSIDLPPAPQTTTTR